MLKSLCLYTVHTYYNKITSLYIETVNEMFKIISRAVKTKALN